MYAMVKTGIDIAFKIFIVSHFAKSVEYDHFNNVDHIWEYSARGLEKSIIYEGESKLNLISYLDFN